MALGNLMSPAVIDVMIGATPGAVVVSYGGVTGWGHYAQVPTAFASDDGVVVSVPSVVVADGHFPGIGGCESDGAHEGVGESIVVGDYEWTIRGIEPGEAPGEIRLMLSNRANG